MNARLLVPVVIATAVFACGGDDKAPEPGETHSPATSAPPSPERIGPNDYWFRGTVSEMNTGCYLDSTCSVTVDVAESLSGKPLEGGTKVEVITSYGFSTRLCEGQWAEMFTGQEVEVLAHDTETDALAACEGGQYFVR